jgi:hypothetical protein
MRRLRPDRLSAAKMSPMDSGAPNVAEAVDRLTDEYRNHCLWFVREDYYASTDEERRWVLDCIERYGDVTAYRRVAQVRQWLSRNSSAPSAAF